MLARVTSLLRARGQLLALVVVTVSCCAWNDAEQHAWCVKDGGACLDGGLSTGGGGGGATTGGGDASGGGGGAATGGGVAPGGGGGADAGSCVWFDGSPADFCDDFNATAFGTFGTHDQWVISNSGNAMQVAGSGDARVLLWAGRGSGFDATAKVVLPPRFKRITAGFLFNPSSVVGGRGPVASLVCVGSTEFAIQWDDDGIGLAQRMDRSDFGVSVDAGLADAGWRLLTLSLWADAGTFAATLNDDVTRYAAEPCDGGVAFVLGGVSTVSSISQQYDDVRVKVEPPPFCDALLAPSFFCDDFEATATGPFASVARPGWSVGDPNARLSIVGDAGSGHELRWVTTGGELSAEARIDVPRDAGQLELSFDINPLAVSVSSAPVARVQLCDSPPEYFEVRNDQRGFSLLVSPDGGAEVSPDAGNGGPGWRRLQLRLMFGPGGVVSGVLNNGPEFQMTTSCDAGSGSLEAIIGGVSAASAQTEYRYDNVRIRVAP